VAFQVFKSKGVAFEVFKFSGVAFRVFAEYYNLFSVGSSTHCDPSALFILGVHTVRIRDIEFTHCACDY
jgi:hypothetical protein